MRTLTIGLILTMLVLGPVVAQDLSKLSFEKFTSSTGKYTAQFPGKPKSQKQSAKTEMGDIQINIDAVSIGQNVAFMISFNDYPSAIKNADPEKLLEGVRDGNKGKDGEIVNDESFQYGPDKLPGRKVLIKKTGGLSMRNMMILKGTRLYQVMVVGSDEQLKSAAVERFQKSFQLAK